MPNGTWGDGVGKVDHGFYTTPDSQTQHNFTAGETMAGNSFNLSLSGSGATGGVINLTPRLEFKWTPGNDGMGPPGDHNTVWHLHATETWQAYNMSNAKATGYIGGDIPPVGGGPTDVACTSTSTSTLGPEYVLSFALPTMILGAQREGQSGSWTAELHVAVSAATNAPY